MKKIGLSNFDQNQQEIARRSHSIDDLLYWKNQHSIFALNAAGNFLHKNLIETLGGKKVAFFHLFFGLCQTNLKIQQVAFCLKYKTIRKELQQKGFANISDQYLNRLFKELVNQQLISRKQINQSNKWMINLSKKLISWLHKQRQKQLLYDLKNPFVFPLVEFFRQKCRFFKKRIATTILMCRRLLLGGRIKIESKIDDFLEETLVDKNHQFKEKILINSILSLEDMEKMFGSTIKKEKTNSILNWITK